MRVIKPDTSIPRHLPFGIRELIMFGVAFTVYKTADHEALKGNEFNFELIRDVAFLL